jgi:hypothetical protein
MRTPWRKTAIILTGAVALASGAYAVGTQAGGGSAVAGDDDSGAGRPQFMLHEPFDDLADALGVDRDELRDAMADFRGRHRSDFADDLAAELGVSADKVEDALRETRPTGPGHRCGPGGPDASGLARALDVTPAELRAALGRIWDDRKANRADGQRELAEFLAGRFNVSVDQVEKALDEALPRPPERRFRAGPGPGFGPPAWHD